MKTSWNLCLTLTVMAGLLAGCVSPDGRPDNTGTGALVGGASGAAIGAIADRGNPGAGALIGGAAGLVAGGLIGHVVDRQQAATPPPPPVAVVIQGFGKPLTVKEVKAMAKSHVSDDVIINQIIITHTAYNLDAKTIVSLKKAGVSERVIAYMINTSAAFVAAQAPPPAPAQVVVASPGPGYIWVDGQWTWNGAGWVWVGGHWVVPPSPQAIWVPPHWVYGPYGWYCAPGYWM